jgi:uncharacterized protein YkwD
MKPRTRIALGVEQLEDRNLMAGSVLSAGVLTVEGSPAADRVSIDYVGSQVRVSAGGGFTEVRGFNRAAVRQVVFAGLGGNDYFINRTSIPCVALGGGGNDTLIGGNAADVLNGGAGNDGLYGLGGNDRLVGGGGRNLLSGGAGFDTFVSTSGLDTILPGPQATTATLALTADQQLIFKLVNQWRAANGRAALRIDPLLQQVAQAHANNMARQDKYGDTDTNGHILDGHDFVWRLAQVNYQWYTAGENVAYNFGYPNPALTLANQWWESLPHRQNMLGADYTVIGIGVARGASGRTYGVQLFAQPA